MPMRTLVVPRILMLRDPTGELVYNLTSATHTQGFEVERNAVIGAGFFLYANGTIGSAKYADTYLWVANSPP